ncbi:uncharacterized protein JCM6883_004604 [Sporobolomyces salmoneus]|uniref:uncharacterized protein n=1 Tax=Sporobolomyces salmoneus TaxID=183962 RepID=UPI00317E4717
MEAKSLSIPKSIGGISDVAASFNLDAHWTAPSPSSSAALEVLTLPTNIRDVNAAWLYDNWNVSSTSLDNTQFVQDPFDSEPSNLVLSVDYPKDSRDGSQFFMTPMRAESRVGTAVLQYQVAFDEDFDFVKGGKLAGLYGSEQGAEGVCSGGNRQPSCWSARLMWRQGGEGEVYSYNPTYPKFCRQSDVICNSEYGISLSRGSFDFKPGEWTTVTQLVALNTPGYANGLLYLWANGRLALAHTGIAWRVSEQVTISKIMFSTFFGGSDSTWNSQGGRSYFRNFEVYAGLSSSNTTGPAVNATLATTSAAMSSQRPNSTFFLCFSLLLLLLPSLVA